MLRRSPKQNGSSISCVLVLNPAVKLRSFKQINLSFLRFNGRGGIDFVVVSACNEMLNVCWFSILVIVALN